MPDQRPPLLLLSSGRCGSTLLQRILNTSGEICLWGEHNGFLRPLAQSYHHLGDEGVIQAEYYAKPQRPELVRGPLTDFETPIKWCNSFGREDVRAAFRRLIESILTIGIDTTKTRWGFKEIRYRTDEPFMPMWRELYPATQFVFLIRHPQSVIQSMVLDWLKPAKEELSKPKILPYLEWAARLWRDMNSAISLWHDDPEIPSILLAFEDLESDPDSVIRDLFSFLNLPLPPGAADPCRVRTSVSRDSELAPLAREVILSAKPEIMEILGEVAQTLPLGAWS